MNKIQNRLMIIHAVILLLFTAYLLFIFLASGHQLNFGDLAQVKMIAEMIIFLSTSIALFFRNSNFLFGKYVVATLLIFTQLSLLDIYLEVANVDYGESKPWLLLLFFFLVFINNLVLIYLVLRMNKLRLTKT